MSNPATAPRLAVDDSFPSSGLHIAKAADATFETGLRGHFAYRNLGMDTVPEPPGRNAPITAQYLVFALKSIAELKDIS